MAKKCLLVMPFSDPGGTNAQYWDYFCQVLSERVEAILPEYKCDRFKIGIGDILSNLIRALVSHDLIICDLTFLKPNVLFELGISMVLQKPIILLVQGDTPIPSDFSNFAYIKYDFDEKKGEIIFPSNERQDLFEKSLKDITQKYLPESPISSDSNVIRILKTIANALKHAIKLEAENAILAPALRSLFDNLISENAEKLSNFIEENKKSVTIKIESPKILFDILIAILNDLSSEDQYDSITWRKHWIGNNYEDSHRFLRAILRKAEDAPKMRRIFLVGITSCNQDGSWNTNPNDITAVNLYYKTVRMLSHRVENRVLFLPDCLIDPVAEICHMGKITKGDSVLYVFSRYSDTGSLESFRLNRDADFKWDFKHFWDLSIAMNLFNWESQMLTIPAQYALFSDTPEGMRYNERLDSLLDKIEVQKAKV